MEQHPVPQDVTGFEFKLIGDMTLKQFMFLASGVVLAYLSFRATIVPSPFNWVASFFFGIGGIAFAFFPIEERPLDRWVTAFFTRVYQPTQYIWRKTATLPEALSQLSYPATVKTPSVQKQKQAQLPSDKPQFRKYVETLPKRQAASTEPEQQLLQNIGALFRGETPAVVQKTPIQQPMQTPAPPPSLHKAPEPKIFTMQQTPQQPKPQKNGEEKSSVDVEGKTKKLNEKIAKLQKELGTQTITRERFLELQKELSVFLQEKETLLQELVSLRKELVKKDKTTVAPTEFARDVEKGKSTVKILPEELAKKKGLPQLTSFPNVITGIIKTPKGELLPNILVTVKDKEEMPVRALKTNKLGQFAASAPLADGTYIIEVEDPQKRYQFDLVEIALSGSILPPLEIFAKGQKELQRESLHKEIFGSQEI